MVLEFGILKSDLFPSSDVSGEGMGASNSTVIWNDVGIGIVPVGSVVAWMKSLTGCPSILPSFVECNGQTLADGDSPFNGQVIPNLNTVQRFLRGASTSGSTGGADTHSHTVASNASNGGAGGPFRTDIQTPTGSSSTLPAYMQVVWIMRIK